MRPRARQVAEPLRLLPSGAGATSPRSLAATAFAVGSVVAAALFARGRLEAAAAVLLDARVVPLVLGAICAPLVPAAAACAWRSVLASRGIRLSPADTWGCYGVGSIANTFLPGRAGDALRIELFSRRLREDGGRWLACGVSVSVALAQSAVFGCVLGAGALLGELPIWTAAPAFALPAATWGIGRLALRRRSSERVARLATAAALSPLAWARVLGWVATAALARLLLAVSVLDALAVPHPLPVALVALCGVAVGNALPLAPQGIGAAAATMSVAIGQAGLSASTALAAGVSFQAFETAAGLLFGTGGWLLLRLAARRASTAQVTTSTELEARSGRHTLASAA